MFNDVKNFSKPLIFPNFISLNTQGQTKKEKHTKQYKITKLVNMNFKVFEILIACFFRS